ncbi:hypothetical protein E7T09_17550 [Deinococcus sp. KSM4-11]|uniref:hypothetical protein n=1 Tax=Deinococcus sp. KSM4-11 TaxID=2568654 RepID=UPI0010A2E9E0|nr:hypothetical protein [Deinococcus sp. KSM4-11]THF85293.1 hypothetical protein E7T09_17550 [Deinococcus sp. KSM4-11]
MTKFLITAVTALTLAASTAFASSAQTYAMDDTGMEYTALQTESSWMAVEVPLAALGGSVPSNLNIAVTGLPAGTTVALNSVERYADTALLYVTVSRSDTSTVVNGVATIAVKSGSTVLTSVSIPVYGAAYGQ